ncbi:glycosyl transferase family 28 [Chelatococcus daeguensis]|uniref:glycosyltransferase n=1 Tax=Chelatococcus daeguensis TaxID=444444 RepID=UPI0007ABDEF5|nr:glycosyltransferase [Chelatococcus daeguensis]KZE35295.1 glycosyl transferase family 28 [Chelatococcus daeguensis]MBM3085263.1 glycosyl transferase family 28 [Chelatococcus daeguensis]
MKRHVLIAVTHLLGAGHLTRMAALARGLARAGHRVTLASGGMPAPLVRLDGVTLLQLPPLRSHGVDFRTLLDANGNKASPALMQERAERLAKAVTEGQPDVVITELFPFGRRMLAAEFIRLIQAARALKPAPLLLASVRDVLVAPARAERIAEAEARLLAAYNGVLVHGDEAVLPLSASWPVSHNLRPLLHYTGYVDEGADRPQAPATGALPEGDFILVSGGASAAAMPLYRATIAAAGLLPEHPFRLLIGQSVAPALFDELAMAAPANCTIERARPDFRTLLARCAASVSLAGYNTVTDLIRTRARAVLVPFEEGNETEQRQRAEHLAASGIAELVPQMALSGERLAEAIARALSRPRPEALAVALDGVERTTTIIERLCAGGSPAAAPGIVSRDENRAWAELDEALDVLARTGWRVGLWWRDDDAVQPSQALDRLLVLSARTGVPVAIAAIPSQAGHDLAVRLAAAPQASVLVHGFAHANHAPAGEKKAEFGPHRDRAEMERELRSSLAMARAVFGEKLVPVFVPPWNRCAPALAPALARAGYAGLSLFGDRTAPDMAGLPLVNTHLDPIDWHGSRSLAEPARLLAGLAEAIRRRAGGIADADEPIGLLTHHLVHDEAVWAFCERLLTNLRNSSAVEPVSALALFGHTPRR